MAKKRDCGAGEKLKMSSQRSERFRCFSGSRSAGIGFQRFSFLMSTTPTPAATKEQRDAAFEKAFAGITPAGTDGIASVLEPFREQIQQRHAMGFTWKQIAEGLKRMEPPIATSDAMLRKLFATRKRHVKRTVAKVGATVNPMPSGTPTKRG